MSLKAPIERIKPNPWNVNILTEEEFKRLKRLMEISGPRADAAGNRQGEERLLRDS
jgi:hypothetical protein